MNSQRYFERVLAWVPKTIVPEGPKCDKFPPMFKPIEVIDTSSFMYISDTSRCG